MFVTLYVIKCYGIGLFFTKKRISAQEKHHCQKKKKRLKQMLSMLKAPTNRRPFTVCRIKIETIMDENYSGKYTDFEVIGISISNLILKEVILD